MEREAQSTSAELNPDPLVQGTTSREPPWWFRDGVLALIIGVMLLGGQWLIDDRRSSRELEAASLMADEADRRENLRFVRDRSSDRREVRSFGGIDLSGLSLFGLELSGADFRLADLQRTNFEQSNLTEARFQGAILIGTNFRDANLAGAHFGCEAAFPHCLLMPGGGLGKANLTEAVFEDGFINLRAFGKETILKGTQFRNVSLAGPASGIDFSHATFSNVRLGKTCYDSDTRWPTSITPPPSANDC